MAVVYAGSKGNVTFKSANGSENTLIDTHAYTIKGADDNYVYVINPHDTSQTIAVPIDVFKSFFEYVDECDL